MPSFYITIIIKTLKISNTTMFNTILTISIILLATLALLFLLLFITILVVFTNDIGKFKVEIISAILNSTLLFYFS